MQWKPVGHVPPEVPISTGPKSIDTATTSHPAGLTVTGPKSIDAVFQSLVAPISTLTQTVPLLPVVAPPMVAPSSSVPSSSVPSSSVAPPPLVAALCPPLEERPVALQDQTDALQVQPAAVPVVVPVAIQTEALQVQTVAAAAVLPASCLLPSSLMPSLL